MPGSGGEVLLSCSRDTCVKFWDLSSGYCTKTIKVSDDWVRCMDLSEDGKVMACAGSDQVVRTWDPSRGELKLEMPGHDHVVECLAWAPVEAYTRIRELIASVPNERSHTESSIRGLPSGTNETKALALQRIQSLRASRGAKNGPRNPGMYLASGSRDKTIRLWDSTGVCVHTFVGHDNWVRAIRFHKGGKYIISASDDKTIKVWDIATGRCKSTVQAHDHFATCMAYIAEKSLLATGSVDQQVKIWEMR